MDIITKDLIPVEDRVFNALLGNDEDFEIEGKMAIVVAIHDTCSPKVERIFSGKEKMKTMISIKKILDNAYRIKPDTVTKVLKRWMVEIEEYHKNKNKEK